MDLPTYEVSERRGARIVRPTGTLTIQTYGHLRDFLLKCVTDQPQALIVDLDALAIDREFLTSVFVTVWMHTALWSTIPLVIVPGPGNRRLFNDNSVHRFLAVRPTVDVALDRLAEPPPRRRTVLWLPPSGLSVGAARGFVTDACRNWRVDAFTQDAITVAGELVTNAVQHAGSPVSVRLELRRARLTVAVADDDPRPVRWPRPTALSQPAASGLPLVMRLSHAHGCSPTLAGGKIVWTVLRHADSSPTRPYSRSSA